MYRHFTAFVAAAALVLATLGGTPAHAGDKKDLARTLAVIAGAAIVGKIIYDKKKDREQERERQRQRQVTRADPQPIYSVPRPPHRQEYTPYPHQRPRQESRLPRRIEPRPLPRLEPRPLPAEVDNRLLPAQCFRSFDTRQGPQLLFGADCLNQNYRFTDRMPDQCLVDVATDDGWRAGYDARCLRDAGYSLARG